MIERMNIKKFGCFSDLYWDSIFSKGNLIYEFKRLNILYGRNYSGKTTLSRIFRSYELGRLPENYKKPEFNITSSDEGSLSEQDVQEHKLDVRVYNKDFINENLSFLRDHSEGEIKTFAIIGSDNRDIEEEISQKEKILGNIDDKEGLRYEHEVKNKLYVDKNKNASQAVQGLENKLRRYANDNIKQDRTIGYPTYNIAQIKNDIQAIEKTPFVILNEPEVRYRQDLLQEKVIPDITVKISFNPKFSSIYTEAKEILRKEIKPSSPLQDLLNDQLLQAWVREGMNYHRNKRVTCGFCGQSLPDDLWTKLDAHFNKESSEMEEELTRQIERIESEIKAVSSVSMPEKDSFYISKRSKFEAIRSEFYETHNDYLIEIRKIRAMLLARQKDIFSTKNCAEVVDYSSELLRSINELNQLIDDNNTTAKILPQQQRDARDELRLNKVADFINSINLPEERQKIDNLKNESDLCKGELEELEHRIRDIESKIEVLQTELQDKKKGAEKVNEYLNHFFGHEGLRLVAVEDAIESKYKFQIMRGDEPAYNMSEGECSLVSFCYFIARLEDIDTKGKDLVIYIDDPISSLDSNHIFFVFSLIESVITKPEKNTGGTKRFRYKQLFISTHNLEFFKYLTRLSRPEKQGGTEFFLVEKPGAVSTLCLMPKYLRDYQTEFHYLFHQIYRCKDSNNAHENHEVFYNFGNNLRKFLEAYLFYKYPYKDDNDSPIERLQKFFGDDTTSTILTNRVGNELSHLEKIFDRSMHPIEIPVIPDLVNFVLDRMYKNDKDQLNALLQSIGEQVRDD